MNERRYNDSRYDFFGLASSIENPRSSVKHTQEVEPNSAGPRSFNPVNRTKEPILFRRTTEESSWGLSLRPTVYKNHSSYCVDKPWWFYFEPLSAIRTSARRPHSVGFWSLNRELPYPISQFPIFGLPENCVDQILSYFDGPDLSALALADKDCRQLARARQFRSVWINFSSASMGLLKKLVNEGCDRAAGRFGSFSQPKWTLGACIRRISIALKSETERSTYKPTSWVDSRRRDNEAVEYHQSHMNALELALQVALPNLEFLDWRDRIPITPILAHAISSSPITRLELHGVTLRDDFDISRDGRDSRMLDESRWKLRRLVLSLTTKPFSLNEGTVVFTRSILKLAAPTLEELIWDGCMCGGGWESYSFGSEPILFKKLKKLYLRRVLMADDTVLSGLVPVVDKELQLTHLWLEGPEKKLGSFFARRGHIPTLKDLNWADFILYQDIDLCISFFSANPQLESFRFEDSMTKLVSERLFPLFASSFHNLTSLACEWETAEVNPSFFGLTGRIITLKHLWLSAGTQVYGEFDWPVNHRILRKKLRPLTQLEWFALTKDRYPNGNNHVRYRIERKSQEWEDGHRRLMVGHALNWARSHPKLEWVYFGQVPMSIQRTGNGTGDVEVVPLTQAREDCEKLLSEMWGEDAEDWVYSK